MDGVARWRRIVEIGRALALGSLIALGACSAADPPFAELPLRDALTADPEVLAAMPEEARRELGERFEEARRGQRGAEPVDGGDGAPGSLVRLVDEERAARGDDALVAVTVREGGGAWTVEPRSFDVRRGAPNDTLPPLAGGATASTAALEQQALAGPAGAVLRDLVRASGARRLVRVTAWPVGAAAAGDAVYVNASWLIALAPAGADGGLSGGPVVLQPLSLGGNPYLTYGSLEACAADVSQRCAACLSSGACDAHPTLQDFADARAECSFLSQDQARPAELCALALLSIGAVGECVRSADASCALPSASPTSASLPEAASFVGNPACVQALDVCLSGSAPPPDASVAAQTIAEPSCEDPFSACASSFKGLDDACKSGSCSGTGHESCTSCSGCKSTSGTSCSGNGCGGSSSSSSCNSGGSSSSSSCNSGGGGSSSSAGNCKCQTQAPPGAPFRDLAWLLAPLGYALLRARRPS